jgi:hypothetical protein
MPQYRKTTGSAASMAEDAGRIKKGGAIMSKINVGRVIAGGILAGIVINAFEYVLHGIVMAQEWSSVMKSLNRPDFPMQAMIWFNLAGFVTGIAAIWTYAAIRPRFGAGAKTAVIAGLLTGVTVYALSYAKPVAAGIYPFQPFAVMLAVEIVGTIFATLAGAWLYQESAD